MVPDINKVRHLSGQPPGVRPRPAKQPITAVIHSPRMARRGKIDGTHTHTHTHTHSVLLLQENVKEDHQGEACCHGNALFHSTY